MKKFLPILILLTVVLTACVPVPASSENITVFSPLSGDVLAGNLDIKGSARVFENVVSYRLEDSDGNILVEDFVVADASDIGQFGDFVVSTNYTSPTTESGVLKVFSVSAKDGSEINLVAVSVQFDN